MTPVIVTYVLMAGPALKQTAGIRGTTANVPMDFQGKIVSCKLIIRHLLFFNTCMVCIVCQMENTMVFKK